jgi:hypothetical protein
MTLSLALARGRRGDQAMDGHHVCMSPKVHDLGQHPKWGLETSIDKPAWNGRL